MDERGLCHTSMVRRRAELKLTVPDHTVSNNRWTGERESTTATRSVNSRRTLPIKSLGALCPLAPTESDDTHKAPHRRPNPAQRRFLDGLAGSVVFVRLG